MSKLDKYIKTKRTGEKELMHPTSVTLDKKQLEFLKRKDLNLSALVRDVIDRLILNEDSDLL